MYDYFYVVTTLCYAIARLEEGYHQERESDRERGWERKRERERVLKTKRHTHVWASPGLTGKFHNDSCVYLVAWLMTHDWQLMTHMTHDSWLMRECLHDSWLGRIPSGVTHESWRHSRMSHESWRHSRMSHESWVIWVMSCRAYTKCHECIKTHAYTQIWTRSESRARTQTSARARGKESKSDMYHSTWFELGFEHFYIDAFDYLKWYGVARWEGFLKL